MGSLENGDCIQSVGERGELTADSDEAVGSFVDSRVMRLWVVSLTTIEAGSKASAELQD